MTGREGPVPPRHHLKEGAKGGAGAHPGLAVPRGGRTRDPRNPLQAWGGAR